MAYDTIKLKSPPLDRSLFLRVREQCLLRSGLDLSSGELVYELYTGQLDGSWDSRISVRPCDADWFVVNGRPVWQPCEPYLVIEASVHKAFFGHNIYGGPSVFRTAARDLVALVESLLGVELLHADVWTVHRVDVAHVFRLSRAACKEFFDSLQLRCFPRRQKNSAKYDMAVYFAGKTTTVKFYHKGSEFRQHDFSRLRRHFRIIFSRMFEGSGKDIGLLVDRRLQALQRLADNRLRVEVEIHADKFQYDFGKNPTVADLSDEYLERIHDCEIERLLREGKQAMDTVRSTTAVMSRLQSVYGSTRGGQLYGFWSALCTLDEQVVRSKFSRPTFFRNRKLLEDAGVSWRASNIVITSNDSLIHDFSPVRSDRRFCSSPARNRPEYSSCRDFLRVAA